MIRDFLKDESGFLGAILGTALGGLIGGGSGKVLATAIGGALGKKSDERSAQKKQAAYDANSYVRMAAAAKKAGLHPLEVLRAGDPAQSTGRMQFGTTAVMQNSFDQIESILTGDYAAEKRREQMKDELLMIDLDQARRGVQSAAVRTGVSSPSLRAATGAPSPTPMDEVNQRPAELTSTSIDAGQGDAELRFSLPMRADASAMVERLGESEIFQEVQFGVNLLEDAAYSGLVTKIAAMEGTSREEINRRVQAGGWPVWRQLRDKYTETELMKGQNAPRRPSLSTRWANPMIARPTSDPRLH